ncbi:hypothetical protein M885DRAFT_505448 [Pelagophyceae sp. CCMP2097]|nr:hypothetical protein M885DRAFT_505448 [Pelagophyceae sp. CCMP2097]|mmetsp:Transcript_11508/g.38435  ORF Transcript_11508/g.38435 Transcript_11508/m.38435 type:complete len:469 (-) Transcript_11508:526-1932(-)
MARALRAVLCATAVLRGLADLAEAAEVEANDGYEPNFTRGRPPLELCKRRVAPWKLWKLFDAHTAVIEGPLASVRVTYRADDSSLATMAGRLVTRVLSSLAAPPDDTSPDAPPADAPPVAGAAGFETAWLCPPPWDAEAKTCALHFSPFGDACIHVERRSKLLPWSSADVAVSWRKDPRARYRGLTLLFAAVGLTRGAPWLSKATGLHYATGMTVGVFASLLLVLLYATHRLRTRRSVTAAVLAALAGYAVTLYRSAAWGASLLLTSYPRLTLIYVAVSAGVSLGVTHVAIKDNSWVTNAVYAACKIAAVALAANSTSSALVSFALALGFAFQDWLDDCFDAHGTLRVGLGALWRACCGLPTWRRSQPDPLEDEDLVSACARLDAAKSPPRMKSSSWREFDESRQVDGSNYLWGHKFLSQEAYEEQSREATRAALGSLVQGPGFNSWVQHNCNRIQIQPLNGQANEDD